jgi:hypothetical protein
MSEEMLLHASDSFMWWWGAGLIITPLIVLGLGVLYYRHRYIKHQPIALWPYPIYVSFLCIPIAFLWTALGIVLYEPTLRLNLVHSLIPGQTQCTYYLLCFGTSYPFFALGSLLWTIRLRRNITNPEA